jgi:hypothetical protein
MREFVPQRAMRCPRVEGERARSIFCLCKKAAKVAFDLRAKRGRSLLAFPRCASRSFVSCGSRRRCSRAHCFPDISGSSFCSSPTTQSLFVAGAMLFTLTSTMQPDRLTLVTFAAAIAVGFIGAGPPWLRPTNGVGFVFVAATGRLAFLNFRPLVVVGQASYSLYLSTRSSDAGLSPT